MAAGPIANFILAIFIFSLIFMIKGKDSSIPIIQEVQKDSPAASAGLKAGDQISFINGTKIESINEVSALINMSGSDDVIQFEITRNSKLLKFEIIPIVKSLVELKRLSSY